MIILGDVRYIHEAQRESPRIICGVKKESGEKYGKENQGPPFR